MTWGHWYWRDALILVSLLFIIPEGYALATNLNNTLSRYARTELGIQVPRMGIGIVPIAWWLSLIAWIMSVGWLTWHIWFETISL